MPKKPLNTNHSQALKSNQQHLTTDELTFANPVDPLSLEASNTELEITQLPVMSQDDGKHSHESCGYHTFKNVLLSLLFQQKIINQEKYRNLLNNAKLFQDIFTNASQIISGQGEDVDLSLPHLVVALQKSKNGEYNFSECDFSLNSKNLKEIDLSKISISNFSTAPNAPEYALNGMEVDLLNAGTAAQLARTRGEIQHVFALGINNQHWVAATVNQDSNGRRKWSFMDSISHSNE